MEKFEVFTTKKGSRYKFFPKKTIGKGAFGIVSFGLDTLTNKQYAIKKVIKEKSITQEELETLQKEITIMEKCYGKPNLSYCIDSHATADFLYIIMPYFEEGNLADFIKRKNIKDENMAVDFLRQICYGLKDLHSQNILHRDLKAENIFLSKCSNYGCGYSVSIGDFGLSKQIENFGKPNSELVGTANTRAPEVETGKYSAKADIYSIGVIFYQMLTNMLPFICDTVAELKKAQIIAQTLNVSSAFAKKLSRFSLRILEGCLQYDCKERITPIDLYKQLKLDNLYSDYAGIDVEDEDETQLIDYKSFCRIEVTEKTQLLSKSETKVYHTSNEMQLTTRAIIKPEEKISPGRTTPPIYSSPKEIEPLNFIQITYPLFAEIHQQLKFFIWMLKECVNNGYEVAEKNMHNIIEAVGVSLESYSCLMSAKDNAYEFIGYMLYSVITREKLISSINEKITVSKDFKWGIHDAMFMIFVISEIKKCKKEVYAVLLKDLEQIFSDYIDKGMMRYIKAHIEINANVLSIIYE